MADEPDYTLAVEGALRGADSQTAQIGAVRAYAGTVLGAGGVSSVASGVAIGGGSLVSQIVGVIALLAFGAVVMCSFQVLRPRDLIPGPNPATLANWADTAGMTGARMRNQLARDFGEAYEENGKVVTKMYVWFWRGLIALVVELAAVAAAFAVRGFDA
jgi:hypothetical protein